MLLLLAAGSPWWPPAVALSAVLLVRALRRLLPRRLRRPGLVGCAVGVLTLVSALSAAGWLLAAAALLAAAVLLSGAALGRHHALVGLLVAGAMAVTGTGGLVVEHLHAQRRQAEQWTQGSALNRAQLLPSSPARAARLLLAAVAAGDPTVCTTMLTPAAGAQLASAADAPDCPAAVRALAGRVTDPRRYSGPDAGATPQTTSLDGQGGTVDLCHMTWGGVAALLNGAAVSAPAPGPQLGRLELTRILRQGFQVTQFNRC